MTVKEAIEQLQKLDPTATLLRGDNLGGYEAVHQIDAELVEEISTKDQTQAVVIK